MGNSVQMDSVFFYGHYAVENRWGHRRASPLRARRSETCRCVYSALPPVRHQPSGWLQMGRAVPPCRSARLGRSLAASAALASENPLALVAGAAATAPAPSPLGRTENSRPLAPGSPARWPARRAHPGQMDSPARSAAAPSAFGPRPGGDAPAVDPTDPAQRGLDRRFQRLVPHLRRHPLSPADRARSAQPLPLGCPGAATPASRRRKAPTGQSRPSP